ncbi:hypothetical protein BDBG_05304 [Blastomyces gilchristii SLH14081]|uniref:Uncharacterized protein n=1 Tax=Blastomyces gilchristii (strain SLH14081) TaxID=559298 RepID=A0A179UQQ8_BLAGS|nr:uncharacterized protein BDBG_05304 [Blastomyces gilchristii SLH14081]OAT09548.1 hypothetical protein BDBG_05304 [Blastomyces gilchristii SLH14081]
MPSTKYESSDRSVDQPVRFYELKSLKPRSKNTSCANTTKKTENIPTTLQGFCKVRVSKFDWIVETREELYFASSFVFLVARCQTRDLTDELLVLVSVLLLILETIKDTNSW